MAQFHVVGGGLAGSEGAWQLLRQGHSVTLYEMRPKKMTPAHQTGQLCELVCSNSLKSMAEGSAPGLLKYEMEALDSLIVKAARKAQVPAGQALAVNREQFSEAVESALSSFPSFKRVDAEITQLPDVASMEADDSYWVVATGPLTSDSLSRFLIEMCQAPSKLHFYDAIAPVIDAESIDLSKGAFWADRWSDEKGLEDQKGSYLNLPLNKQEYETFIDAVQAAEMMPLHSFEEVHYFESCLPIEVMVERGKDTLRFGPMKPAGLTDPRTGRWPYAAIQLRLENVEGTMLSMVGFQTKMKWPEQKRVFGLIPGLESAEFFRFGSVHKNTYLHSPSLLRADLSFKANPRVFLAGQISGVEGYTESAAMGLLVGRFAHAKASKRTFESPPRNTMLGALLNYVTHGGLGDYQPMNANLGLLSPIEKQKGISKADRKLMQVNVAKQGFDSWKSERLQN
jgi:methylenetetrahydrofolate--tRNA-(uracil-5-)-methyltransferase